MDGQLIPFFVGAILTIVGSIFAFTGLRTRRSWKRFVATSVATQAQVMDLRFRSSRTHTSGRNGYYVPLLRFSLPDDRIVEAETSFGTNPPPAQPGEIVAVRYDPENPTKVELATGFAQGGTLGTIFTVFGVMFVLIGVLVLVGSVTFVALVDLP